ncbi:PREDICTED: uncharacterized protein LOC104767772 [Camelina sativa]|uniref:Uncharacterized protein LOC104767772 n=1 Tax=Camelina sativa TaxID=90675 RepID=A0ABM0XRW1_CAMSA|nr:PREDICTED: uncharacterized protein LOC104767772 [Camelina sativa]
MDEAYKLQSVWYHHEELNSAVEGDSDSRFNKWNDEIFRLYEAADEFMVDEFGNMVDLGDSGEVEEKKKYDFLAKLADAETPLYPSKLSAIVTLFRIKSQNGWSDKSFNDLLETLLKMLPKDNVLHTSLYEMKKFLKSFDIGYQKIHACVNDCSLFRKKYKTLDKCPKCKTSRWKTNMQPGEVNKGVPQKVLRYFPIIPRLKRMFRSEKTAKDLRWHFTNKSSDGKLRHPVDSVTWNHMNDKYPSFAAEERNMRLGLSIDGFNPYNMKNTKYSCWPVLLVNYNLPPDLCMKNENIMLTLLIPGPQQPGCKVKGQMGCPLCGKNTNSMWLKFSRKHVYMSHRKGLPPTHSFRGKKSWFDVRILSTDLSEDEDEEIEVDEDELSRWKKRSIFFNLPYWENLPVWHNLDVMHVERNVAASIVSTLLHCGKSKDGLQARKDLEYLGIRKDLHPKTKGKITYLPAAPRSLSKTEKKVFCRRIFDFKGPDGYCSDISKGVSLDDCKITGLKSHDYHVLMKQLLPIALRGLLPKGPRIAIVTLCKFYNQLCQRVIDREQLLVMEAEIVGMLCMYMMVLKDFVRNPAKPEGCMAESYLVEECIHFCSEFLKKTTNVEEKLDRNTEYENSSILEGRPISVSTSITLTEMETKIAHLVVIQNVAIVDPYVDEHLQYLQDSNGRCRSDASHLWKMHTEKFVDWLKKKISLDSDIHEETLKWLAYGPRSSTRSYTGYIVNGQRFHTSSVDRKSQNSGILYEATAVCRSSAKDTSQVVVMVSYYGRLTDIILLDYNVFYVPLFRCQWAVMGNGVKVDDGFTLVNLNHSQISFLRDPYILASQAKQVFYSREDETSSWYVVMRGP